MCWNWMRRRSANRLKPQPGPKVSGPTTSPWKFPACAPVAREQKPMTEALANLEGVTVQFDDRLVVNRVSLTVHRGDIITIIGPNGAGKTTLIKTVLGLQRATSGKVSRAPGAGNRLCAPAPAPGSHPAPERAPVHAAQGQAAGRVRGGAGPDGGKPFAGGLCASPVGWQKTALTAGPGAGAQTGPAGAGRTRPGRGHQRPGRTVRTDPGAAGRTALRRHHDLPRFAPGDGCHRQGDLPEPARLLQRLSGGYFPRPGLYRNLRPPGGGIAGGVSPPP